MTRLFTALRFTSLAVTAFAQQPVPEIRYDADADLLKLPDNLYLGEASGVAVNSKGHIFVFNRGTATENELYVAEILNWRVQKLTLHPDARQTANR